MTGGRALDWVCATGLGVPALLKSLAPSTLESVILIGVTVAEALVAGWLASGRNTRAAAVAMAVLTVGFVGYPLLLGPEGFRNCGCGCLGTVPLSYWGHVLLGCALMGLVGGRMLVGWPAPAVPR